jgi:hypothetical protein
MEGVVTQPFVTGDAERTHGARAPAASCLLGCTRRVRDGMPREPDPEVRRQQIRRARERAAQMPTEMPQVANGIAT